MKRLSCLILPLAIACSGEPPAPAEAPNAAAPEKASSARRSVRVEVATLEASPAQLELTLPGEVVAAHDVALAAPIGGLVERVLVDAGDKVRPGQPLAYVNSSVLEAQRAQAEAALEQAQSTARVAEAAGESYSKLRRDTARFQLKNAEAAHRLASINHRRSILRADFEGVVAARFADAGEVLAPGAPVFRLVSLRPIEIALSVSDRDVGHLVPGLSAQVVVGADPAPIAARVARVSPAADLRTRTFETRLTADNQSDRLRPGMIATARVQVDLGEAVLSIPQYVLVTKLDENGVYVVENGVARWRPLELGVLLDERVVVRKGLSPGAVVVTTGHRELVDGDAVTITRQGRCCVGGRIEYGGA